MKFTNYKNWTQALTGLVQDGWTIGKIEMSNDGVSVARLYNEPLDLRYILEHHTNSVTFEESSLEKFVRPRGVPSRIYERERGFDSYDVPPSSEKEVLNTGVDNV